MVFLSQTDYRAAATELDASDLHLVSGVPPAFRVNGEIILADEDALSEGDLCAMAEALLNAQQKAKFEEEWELCISQLHSVAGRVRVTFIVDTVLVVMLTEVISRWFSGGEWQQFAVLGGILATLGAIRVVAVRYSPAPNVPAAQGQQMVLSSC